MRNSGVQRVNLIWSQIARRSVLNIYRYFSCFASAYKLTLFSRGFHPYIKVCRTFIVFVLYYISMILTTLFSISRSFYFVLCSSFSFLYFPIIPDVFYLHIQVTIKCVFWKKKKTYKISILENSSLLMRSVGTADYVFSPFNSIVHLRTREDISGISCHRWNGLTYYKAVPTSLVDCSGSYTRMILLHSRLKMTSLLVNKSFSAHIIILLHRLRFQT